MHTSCIDNDSTKTLLAAESFTELNELLGEENDPLLISSTTYLDESHPLRKEAILIMDALAAVTNGIQDYNLIKEIKDIKTESPFYSWQQFILTLHNIYKTNSIKAKIHIDRIDKDSPLSIFVPYLKALTEGNAELSEDDRRFLDSICQDTNLIDDIFKETQKYLEEGRLREAEQFSCLLITELGKIDMTYAKKTAVSLILEFDRQDYSAENLTETLTQVLGTAETKRLIAIAYLEEDPEISLMAWLQYTLLTLRESSNDSKIKKLLIIIHALLEFINNNMDNTEFCNTYTSYLAEINNTLKIDFPHLAFDNNSEQSLTGWEKALKKALEIKEKKDSVSKKTIKRNTPINTEQLEFDF